MDTNYPGAGAKGGPQLIEQVHEGMAVVDAAGHEIGKVDIIRMGDPEALTTEGQERDDLTVGEGIFGSDEPDLPRQLRKDLLRMGFLKVGHNGFLGIGRKWQYVRSDQIADVSGDQVVLTKTEDKLPDEDRDGPLDT